MCIYRHVYIYIQIEAHTHAFRPPAYTLAHTFHLCLQRQLHKLPIPCIYLYTHSSIYTYAGVHTHIYIYTSMCMHIYIHISLYISTYTDRLCIHKYIITSIHVSVHICSLFHQARLSVVLSVSPKIYTNARAA